jgi:hypothetical protein
MEAIKQPLAIIEALTLPTLSVAAMGFTQPVMVKKNTLFCALPQC